MKMSLEEFALAVDMSPQEVLDIYQGKKEISENTAQAFEKVLSIPARFWINREKNYRDWLKNSNLDALALQQNVKPMKDIRELAGSWPGEMDDGFEDLIDEMRHDQMNKEE